MIQIKQFALILYTLFISVLSYSQTTLNLVNSYSISDDVSEPSGLTYDKINNQLFTVSDTGDIYRLSITGNLLDTYNLSGDLEGISTYNTPNTLLVAIEDTYQIIEYNYVTGNSTSHTMEYENQEDPGSGIEGVTYNSNTGEIYFLNEKEPGALIVANSNFNVTDEYELTYAGDYSASYYVEETNELWLGSDNSSTIYKCNTDGSVIESFEMNIDGDELDKLEGIAIDYDNQLLYIVTDGGGELLVYQINTETIDSNLTVSSINEFNANGGSQTITVNSNIDWTVSENSNWITTNSTSGSNNGSVLISANQNTSTNGRSATITITGSGISRTVTVSQEGAEEIDIPTETCTTGTNLSLNSTIVSFSGDDRDNIAANAIDGNPDNRWSAEVFPQNIVFDLGNSFNVNEINLLPFQDRAYQFTVEGSTSSATASFFTLVDATNNTTGGNNINRTFTSQNVRYVRLTLTGASQYNGPWASVEDFEIICAGVDTTTPTEALTVSLINEFDASEDSQTVTVTSNTDWTVSENSNWISIDNNSGSGNGFFSITTTENTSINNRSATLIVTGNDISRSILVSQEGAEDIFIPSESCSAGTNLSLNGTIVDFSAEQNNTNTVQNIIDDSTENRWSAQTFPQYATIDLGDEYNVNEISLATYLNRDYQFIVDGSLTSATSGFSTLVDARNNTSDGTITETFSSQTVRYVRLTITGANNYTGPWSSISKFEIICAGTTSNKSILEQEENLFQVTTFPNPYTETITVNTINTNQAIDSLELVDFSGRTIIQKSMNPNEEITLDNLDGLANGVYLLLVFDSQKKILKTMKVVKE